MPLIVTPFTPPGPDLARRRPPVVVLLAASLLEVAAMAALGVNRNHHDIIGVTGAVAVLIAVAAAVASGPWVGLGVAAVGGVAFYGFISDFGSTAPLVATVVSVAVWGFSAVIAGVVADRLRDQQAARRSAQHEASLLHAQLEAGLLPRLRSSIGPLHLVWRYLPSEQRLGVGGDFYDAAMIPDGRTALIIGDVIGHGPHSAALGATLRAGWYALVRAGASAEQVVTTLADTVGHAQPLPDVLVTACLVWFTADASEATVIRLGHPRPLLLTGDGVIELETAGSLPLGAGEEHDWEATVVPLPPSWQLLLYTDGLIEGRSSPSGSERYGLPRLLTQLDGGGSRFGEQSLDALLDDVTAANGGPLPDDVAVLLVSAA